jgi:hypothetical protein
MPLGEEVSVGGPEVRPFSQVLAGVGHAFPFDGQRPQPQVVLGLQRRSELRVAPARPGRHIVEDPAAGQGGDVVGADVLELGQVDERAGGAEFGQPDGLSERLLQRHLGEPPVGQAAQAPLAI